MASSKGNGDLEERTKPGAGGEDKVKKRGKKREEEEQKKERRNRKEKKKSEVTDIPNTNDPKSTKGKSAKEVPLKNKGKECGEHQASQNSKDDRKETENDEAIEDSETPKSRKVESEADGNEATEKSQKAMATGESDSKKTPGKSSAHTFTAISKKNTEGPKRKSGPKQPGISLKTVDDLIELAFTLDALKAEVTANLARLVGFEQIINQVEDATINMHKTCSNGQLIWKIRDFSERMREAKLGERTALYSPPFETNINGYKMALSLCPYGDGKAKGTHMSLFLCLLKGMFDAVLTWPFCHPVVLTLIDQDPDPHRRQNLSTCFSPNPIPENEPFLGRPTTYRNPSLGVPRFVSHKNLYSRNYMRDDTVFIMVNVKIDEIVPVS